VSIPAQTPFPAIVIGGGISGLACAYHLQQAGIPARVLDAAPLPGGVISTQEKDGFRFELGPQSFLSTEPLLTLIEALGLKDELLHADSRAPRYVLSRGKLVPAPLAPPSLLTTRLLGAGTKWRVFTEMLQRTVPPATDESIASFIRRKFGDELLNQLVAPFVSGIYAGDPEKLSLRASFPKLHEFETEYGSVLRGAMKSRPAKGSPRPGLCSFRDGMDTLPRTLARRLGDALLSGDSVVALRHAKPNGKSWFEVEITRFGHQETLAANSVVFATPTDAASQILTGLSAGFKEIFDRIEYAPVAVVAAGYRREQIQENINGFGFLVPRGEGLRVLGTVWNSSLFRGRAPGGMECFTSFAGGATDPGLCELTDDEISTIVCGEVGRILRITGPPVTTMIHRYARALPQYNLGHAEIISALGALTSGVPGLFLAGNYLSGPSIGACVEQANQTADAVRIYLASVGIGNVGAVAHA
jgi:protoporphyrinogen/coproporphyrinogen III oxidase